MLSLFKKTEKEKSVATKKPIGKKKPVSKDYVKEVMKQDKNKILDFYSVAATLYSEAKDLDNKGITRVAETIRNRYNFYNKNKTSGVSNITYRDIVIAKGQYIGFNKYKGKKVSDFKKFEQNLTGAEKKKWERCKLLAAKLVSGKLNTNYARGAMGFNQASISANKKLFKTQKVFKDDSHYTDNPSKKSPHVFFGDFEMPPLKTPQGKLLAKGGNPAEEKTGNNLLLAQAKAKKRDDRI